MNSALICKFFFYLLYLIFSDFPAIPLGNFTEEEIESVGFVPHDVIQPPVEPQPQPPPLLEQNISNNELQRDEVHKPQQKKARNVAGMCFGLIYSSQ